MIPLHNRIHQFLGTKVYDINIKSRDNKHVVIKDGDVTITLTEWPDSSDIINMNVKMFSHSFNRIISINDVEEFLLDRILNIKTLKCELIANEVQQIVDSVNVNYDHLSDKTITRMTDVVEIAAEITTLLKYIDTSHNKYDISTILTLSDDILYHKLLKRMNSLINNYVGDGDYYMVQHIADEFTNNKIPIMFECEANSCVMFTNIGYFRFGQ